MPLIVVNWRHPRNLGKEMTMAEMEYYLQKDGIVPGEVESDEEEEETEDFEDDDDEDDEDKKFE